MKITTFSIKRDSLVKNANKQPLHQSCDATINNKTSPTSETIIANLGNVLYDMYREQKAVEQNE